MVFVKNKLVKPDTVEAREYQEYLVIRALERGNTLIVAPTALGKTIVALLVSAEVLKEEDNKVLFLAPTKPLVNQHFFSFKKFLNMDSFAVLTGSTSPSERKKALREKRVIFATPQTIRNDALAGKVDFSDIGLMIIDEAHRAVGDYAYVFLADIYQREAKKPLILALTASPGGTREKILEICSNLHVENIEIKTEEDEDVSPYMKEREVEWRYVDFDGKLKQLAVLVKGFVDDRVNYLRSKGILKGPYVSKTKLLETNRRLVARAASNPSYYTFIKELSALIKAQHAHEMLETQCAAAAQKYLRGFFAKDPSKLSKSEKMLASDTRIVKVFNETQDMVARGEEHPKVAQLVKEVTKALGDKESRVIVFSHFRETAQELAKRLNEVDGVSAARFVGQATREGDRGLNQKEQLGLISDFRGGKINVLVATSVAEEGLDIPSVDCVVFYEPVASEIRLIQRMGRTGRKEKGRVVILLAKGTRDEAYYWSSVNKEKRMKKVLHSLQRAFSSEKPSKEKQKTLSSFSSTKKQALIYADHRERNKDILKQLEENDVAVKQMSLPVGDFLLSEGVVAERKEAKDFVQSIIDGRLFKQARELSENFEKPLLVLEGKELYGLRGVHDNAIRGALASVATDHRIPIIRSRDASETALFLALIAKRLQLKCNENLRLRGEKRALTPGEEKRFVVESLPNIGPSLAKALLEKFGTVEKVFSASERELRETEKIGEKKAKRIRKLLTEKYEE